MIDTIVANKFNGNYVDYSIQEGSNTMFNICVYGHKNSILYYQTYKIVNEYCGDISFVPIPNEFNNGMLFTTKELKILFEIDCKYPDADYYYLDNLFNSA